MLRNVLIVVLAVGLAGTTYWGYQQKKEKNAILINAENNYQRAFNELAHRMDVLNDKIGTTLAMNTRTSISPALVEVWRLTSEAHGTVGQLPLTLMPFNKTEEFLSKIGDFAYRTSIRDLDKEPLTNDEYKTLKNLYASSNSILSELRNVQNLIIEDDLKWMDVEMALADSTGDSQKDNQVIDGLKTVEKNVTSFGQKGEFGPTFTSVQQKNSHYEHLKDAEITRKEAIARAASFANISKPVNPKVTENKKGSNYSFYHVSMKNPQTKESIGMDLTKKGGYPIYFMTDRKVADNKISLNEGSIRAKKYLDKMKYTGLTLFESTQYKNIGVYTFVTEQNGVRIYPEAIKIKVALDNGQIVGLMAEDYLKSHHARKMEKPVITENQARKSISPKVEIQEHRLAVVTNDLYEDVLCHEFLGTIGRDTYRIFINAKTGTEEKVEKMHDARHVYKQVS